MPMIINYNKIPQHCRGGMRRYIEEGYPVGDFLMAVLENNLVEAYARADDINTACMRSYADFLYNEAPRVCWGSRKIVTAWLEMHAERREAERKAKEGP